MTANRKTTAPFDEFCHVSRTALNAHGYRRPSALSRRSAPHSLWIGFHHYYYALLIFCGTLAMAKPLKLLPSRQARQNSATVCRVLYEIMRHFSTHAVRKWTFAVERQWQKHRYLDFMFSYRSTFLSIIKAFFFSIDFKDSPILRPIGVDGLPWYVTKQKVYSFDQIHCQFQLFAYIIFSIVG